MQMKRQWRALALASVLVIFALVGSSLGWRATASAGEPQAQVNTVKVKETGIWTLYATTGLDENGRPIMGAGVSYQEADAMKIGAYADVVRGIGVGAFAGERLPVLVTFKRPVSSERFTDLMREANAGVTSYRLRTFDADGNRGIIGGAPESDGTILNFQHAQQFADRYQTKTGRAATIAGVIDAEITIDAAGYAALSAQSDVYLVDVMRGVAARELAQARLAGVKLTDIYLRGPYPSLEALGVLGR